TLRRQLTLLDHDFTRSQLPEATLEDLVRRSTELEGTFTRFRATLGGERVTNNRILDVLTTETDSAVRREAWEASKQIGREAAEPLRELVRRRNAAARELGYADYYAMELALQEQDETRLFAVLDEFRDLSDAPFRAFREELDRSLAARFGVRPDELRPWHWEDPFAQEAPAVGSVDLDGFFRELDLVGLSAWFFRGIGLPVDDVLERSDLYEREGKDQHAFCVAMDREGDVRTLCNLRPNEKWASTLLHELGHAAYDKFLPMELPFVLRRPAHTLSTESIAMYMGRLTREPAWLREVAGAHLTDEQAHDVRAQLRAAMLVSTRWMLVMVNFERALYHDPDRPDLNALWWDLVERMQMVRRPDGRDEPDWAAKIHLSTAPVYYHNYLLGELMASQISATSREGVPEGRSIAGQRSVGTFLRERIFAPGASVDWNELLVHATGEPLSARHFIHEFVDA
ncbi:MAG TPA: M2 family metallopeptidase, partial [Longimicrobiaceae bacterium]|nr:M2 family metallopeptidase [Longimicrobiaceae bacterium]